MESRQMNEIIYEELKKLYKLCKYAPSPVNWQQWLETQHPVSKEKLEKLYTWESAWQKVFQYTHWFVQQYHKKEIDSIMQMALLPEVYEHYLKRYKAIEY